MLAIVRKTTDRIIMKILLEMYL